MAAQQERGVVEGPRGRASCGGFTVKAYTEVTRLWEVAAHAATAATRAAVAAGAKTPTALTEATVVAAATAARAAVTAAKTAEARKLASLDTLDALARVARGLKPRQSAEGASGSGSGGDGGGGGTPTPAEPAATEMKTERAPLRVTPSPQTATTKEVRSTARDAATAAAAAAVSEEAAGVAADEIAKTEEGAMAAATHAPDRDTLVKRLYTFARNARAVILDDIASWDECELSGDWAAVAAAAEGGDAKAQLAMWFATNISNKKKLDWMVRAMDQGYLDALLHSGFMLVMNACSEAEQLEGAKERAMRDLKMPAASGSEAAQHATVMLMYCFDCDSGAQEDFLDAARYIRKAVRQGLDVVGLYTWIAVDHP
jgi:hypothetical protein